MEYTHLSIRILKTLADSLEDEAIRDGRNRSQMLAKILRDRYGLSASLPNQLTARKAGKKQGHKQAAVKPKASRKAYRKEKI